MKLYELLDAHVTFRRIDGPKGPVIFYDPEEGKHYKFQGWSMIEVGIIDLDPNGEYEVLDA